MLLAEEGSSAYTKSPMIEPGKSYEACMKLSPGDKLYYEFTSSADLRLTSTIMKAKKYFILCR